ncbi:hypothetical protein, unlikely [Trypanosoma brucei gambiense DAL972]|uniref:RNA polymerase Rpb2 domain-containing protein n=1 Tax=Trypanosoma brucei gambiense (strain MHOM/CI/86/DAL972) TaxID=679716 RepID=D0A6L9_TRYB9|nr:hypothetical protein, unlikely [Trypanosoma brucei gambiense DAL972]CBH17320.1 hypothetical protein, unlikely [Trypanosoma brucei gambiense DAL972]|eukprot:XP_011779584.1 hypothetical protein, unlikely [Trypanosoma brucei gambiense DAL972]
MCVYRYMIRLCRDVLRTLRRSGRLHPHVSIAINDRQKSVQIVCVGRRIVRLYVFVSDGKHAVISQHLDNLSSRK